MQIGLTGFVNLSWPGLLRLRAESASKPAREKTAIIMVWLGGGLSHLDSYDPKPDLESEYRGPFETISTKVPGLQFTELFPLQAKIADKFTILRSMTHKASGHSAGCKQDGELCRDCPLAAGTVVSPGTLVEIVSNGPQYSLSRSGFRRGHRSQDG